MEFQPREKISVDRRFTRTNRGPYDDINWTKRDAVLMGPSGKPVFEQKDVEAPDFWSDTAVTIAAQKYFRGKPGSPERETSIRGLIDRVVDTITRWGLEDGYFGEDEARVFSDELKWLLVHQYGAFNSPVWFNVGVEPHPQASACFILEVEDTMDSILRLAHTEGMIFKWGSGSGVNFSSLRSSKETLSGGGQASGPVSFMKGFDAFAGVIKSGGKTRRAAKMAILNVDHPDIDDFIWAKAREEEKAKALVRAGYDSGIDGEAYSSVFFQNANHSVRVTDSFMEAVERDDDWALRSVTTGEVVRTVQARKIWRDIAEAAWQCGDPGVQFHDTINHWHTCLSDGPIVASNPCSEFMFLNNSACNLASLNLMKFLSDDGSFETDDFVAASRLFLTAQDILVDRASYPTEEIGQNSKIYRPLGLGYANLGALLMYMGMPYDSDEGRAFAAAVTALMTGASYEWSAELACQKGPFERFEANRDHMIRVLRQHAKELENVQGAPKNLMNAARNVWKNAVDKAEAYGVRNAQVSLLAPTGTIGFLMDADSTGIEPLVALVLYKFLVGGGTLKLVSRVVRPALEKLGYSTAEIHEIMAYLEEHGTMEGAPHLHDEHLAVFDTALKPAKGTRTIHYMGHLKMMAAVQPFLSGAISKTVNLPKETTVEEIESVYQDAWRMGLKAVAIYRDGSKGVAPLTTSKEEAEGKNTSGNVNSEEIGENLTDSPRAVRKHLPEERASITHKFEVGGHEGYVTVGYYKDGHPGEIFVKMAKEGSTISGLMDAFSIAISIGLQHGVPLDLYVKKFKHMKFEPEGFTGHPKIHYATSIVDYLFKWLELRHPEGTNPDITYTSDPDSGSVVFDEPKRLMAPGQAGVPEKDDAEDSTSFDSDKILEFDTTSEQQSGSVLGDFQADADAPVCPECGFTMVRNGSCYKCLNCGATSGCS